MYNTPRTENSGQAYAHTTFLIRRLTLSTKGKSMKFEHMSCHVEPIGTRHLPGSPRVPYMMQMIYYDPLKVNIMDITFIVITCLMLRRVCGKEGNAHDIGSTSHSLIVVGGN